MRRLALPVSLALAIVVLGLPGSAQHSSGTGQHSSETGHHASGSAQHPAAPAQSSGPVPRRVTMEELHQQGGVPRGWKFTVPLGDAVRGREIFRELECHKCHTIKGEVFPATSGDPKNVGPELTGMGSRHSAEYFAESILAPNHVIVQGAGYTGPDGLSVMPSFADSLSVTQWLDLVAYLTSLTGGGDDPDAAHEVTREQTAGDYRIRLVYAASVEDQRGRGAPSDTSPARVAPPHAHHGAPASGHLMVFVEDREAAEAVPYLPVTATVHAAGAQPRLLRLAPMVNERGFHYGADVTLGERTQRITLALGATTMRVAGSLKDRFKKPVTAVFEWKTK